MIFLGGVVSNKYGLSQDATCYGHYSSESASCKECAISYSCRKNTELTKEFEKEVKDEREV